jgi:hypothetical protein
VVRFDPIALRVFRDNWDWIVLVLTCVAAVTATVAFLAWVLDRRRRPELAFLWQYSLDPNGPLLDWPPDLTLDLSPGATVLVRVGCRNIGDALADNALINFVAPDVLEIEDTIPAPKPPNRSNNPVAGLPPDLLVSFFAPTVTVAPNDWWMRNYNVRCPDLGLFRLLFDVSHARLNTAGRRWFPNWIFSIAQEDEPQHSQAGDAWPAKPWPRVMRRVRAEPHKRIECSQGARKDIRDIRVKV